MKNIPFFFLCTICGAVIGVTALITTACSTPSSKGDTRPTAGNDRSPTSVGNRPTHNKARQDRTVSGTLLSKEELLGEDYKTPPNSLNLRKSVDNYLNQIEALCTQTTQTPGQKATQLSHLLQELKAVINTHLREPYLETQDSIYLRTIKNNISPDVLLSPGGELNGKELNADTIKSQASDLKNNFLFGYHTYYNIPAEQIEPSAIREQDEWAKKIYAGLSCI